MKKPHLILGLLLLGTLVFSQPASAQRPSESGASGNFSLSVHAHSSQFTNTLFPTDPLETDFREGDSFSYSSIPCSQPAPFNDTSLEFSPDYPGIEDPASTRHFVEGTVTEVDPSDRTGTIEGTITTILCLGGEESENTITTGFRARFVRTSDNQLRLVGRYEITGGTGVFADLSGSGRIKGSLTCLPSTLQRQGATSCEDLGVFADAVLQLNGTFRDPTVATG
jgi:hypothetical protein